MPDRRVVGVGDASFASIDLLNEVGPWLTMITRLRLDAALFIRRHGVSPDARAAAAVGQTPAQPEAGLANAGRGGAVCG